MRLPKIVQICGKTYIVTKNKKKWSSEGKTGTRKIEIGTRWNSDEHEFEDFLHETAELVCCEKRVHYRAADDSIQIVMNHKEFSDFINDVATAIRPIIKE